MSTFRQHLDDLRRRARTPNAILAIEQLGVAYSDMNLAAGRLQERYRARAAVSTRLPPSKDEVEASTAKFEADLFRLSELHDQFLLIQEVDSETSVDALRRMTAEFRSAEAEDLAALNSLRG